MLHGDRRARRGRRHLGEAGLLLVAQLAPHSRRVRAGAGDQLGCGRQSDHLRPCSRQLPHSAADLYSVAAREPGNYGRIWRSSQVASTFRATPSLPTQKAMLAGGKKRSHRGAWRECDLEAMRRVRRRLLPAPAALCPRLLQQTPRSWTGTSALSQYVFQYTQAMLLQLSSAKRTLSPRLSGDTKVVCARAQGK